MYTGTQPVSVLLDGPVFADELAGYPQQLRQFREEHGLDQRRLVPAKSAARGVHTVYFLPEHREWALVRLARRYRWVVEVQLLRGMSGERQLLRGEFTPDDVGFLADIVPEPPAAHSPIVYDLLWLAATTEAYVRLAAAIREHGRFQLRDLLTTTEGLSLDDANYLTRFLRSHLVQRVTESPKPSDDGSTEERGETSVTLDATYEVTDEGQEPLDGIVSEYERIFEREAFDPLLVDPERDPVSHLRSGEAVPEEERDTPDEAVGAVSQEPTQALRADGVVAAAEQQAAPDADDEATDYSDEELLEAVRAACEAVAEANVARSETVKRTVWDAVDRDGRSKAALWEDVVAVLLETEAVNGRPGGRVWTAGTFTDPE